MRRSCSPLLALALALAAPTAILVVAGQEFAPAVPLLRIQAIALAAAFVSQTFGFALLSLHRHRETLVACLSALVFTAGLTVALDARRRRPRRGDRAGDRRVGLALGLGVAFHRALPDARIPLGVVWRIALAAAAGGGLAVALGGRPARAGARRLDRVPCRRRRPARDPGGAHRRAAPPALSHASTSR